MLNYDCKLTTVMKIFVQRVSKCLLSIICVAFAPPLKIFNYVFLITLHWALVYFT